VDRKKLQWLADERLKDARALLGRKQWSGAYHLCGYAVECALKSCLLRHLGESGAVFGDPNYLKRLAGCWTPDLAYLMSLAGLEAEFGAARGANPPLENFWVVTTRWDERELFEAVSHKPDGVFVWIRSRW
jgi:HEPN domain-containing protein